MKIAIVTYQELNVFKSDVPNEDEMLLNLFHHKGYSPSYTIWDDESVDWSQYDALIIKSTWDYFFDKIDRFYQWLEHIQSLGLRCFNAPDLVRWNADKIYLKDISGQGFRTVPTLYIDKDLAFEVSECRGLRRRLGDAGVARDFVLWLSSPLTISITSEQTA